MSLKILLLDDIPKNREEVKDALTEVLGQRGTVQEFMPSVGGGTEGVYEKRLVMDFLAPPNNDAHLIVADRDLSSYKKDYSGLSEETVRIAADTIGIPECGYARGEREDDADYVRRGQQREACIRLSLRPIEHFAHQIVEILEGFEAIANKLPETIKGTDKRSPGSLLANLLGKPEYAEKISLYASGDQNRFDSLALVRNSKDESERMRRLVCLLGYWLWDSVLRFPGVVVNETAASSYLNILEETFKSDPAAQALFSAAQYRGPFSEARDRIWWRGMLDDIVAASGCEDGRDFASKELDREISQSQCYVDQSKTAGFYCMLEGKPVSLSNSKGGLPWFPRGADIARVGTPRLEELGPWL